MKFISVLKALLVTFTWYVYKSFSFLEIECNFPRKKVGTLKPTCMTMKHHDDAWSTPHHDPKLSTHVHACIINFKIINIEWDVASNAHAQ